MLQIKKLLEDHRVDYQESSDGKWINTACPFCYKGDGKYGLGYNLEKGYFTCFKCSGLSDYETIAKMLSIDLVESRKTCLKYKKAQRHRDGIQTGSRAITTRNSIGSEAILPYGTMKMTDKHRKYLQIRDFDPDYLEREWGLLGTGALGEFKHRIIIPVHQDEKVVCYQCRDISGKASAKYKSCHDEDAIIPIKSCLYGIDKCAGNDWIVITEGVTKVWRLGPGSVATFGTIVLNDQLSMLKRFKKRIIVFDQDEAGQEGANKLAGRLSIFGGYTEILFIDGVVDVAELPQEQANHIIKKTKDK